MDQVRNVVDLNPALSAMLLFAPEELIGGSVIKIHFSQQTYQQFQSSFNEAFNSAGTVNTEYQFRRKDGSTLWAKILGARITLSDGQPGVLWSIVDTTDLHDMQEKLAYQAFHDALTGLPNRRALDARFQQMMQLAHIKQETLLVALIDLDNFKPINDTYGHDAGDEVLCVVSKRLKHALSAQDFVARLGGDEFVLVLRQIESPAAIDLVFSRLRAALNVPIQLGDGTQVQVGMSVGMAQFPEDDAENPDILLRYADQALYASKAHKQGRALPWVRYGTAVRLKQNTIQRQLEESGPEIWYQPIVDIQRGLVVGFEALARFKTADGHLLEPREFMPELSKADLTSLTLKAFAKVLRDLPQLNSKSDIMPWVSINLPPQAVDASLVAALTAIFSKSGEAAERIIFEIMEGNHFDEQITAINHLTELKALGIQLAIDDVGVGYASLQRIRELPIDKIKLDQTFVRSLQQNPRDIHFVRSVQELAQGLNLELIVEGVETPAILNAMQILGVQFVQGFCLFKPMALETLATQLGMQPVHAPIEKQPCLLGVYAAQFALHSSLLKIIRTHPKLMTPQHVSDATCCPVHTMLQELNAENRIAPLVAAHNNLHTVLGAVMNASTPMNWRQAHAAQKQIETIILALIAQENVNLVLCQHS